MSHEQSCTYIRAFSEITEEELKETLLNLKSGGVGTMKTSLADENAALHVVYQADMRYKGQAMTLTVDLTSDEFNNSQELVDIFRSKFNEAHQHQFGFSHAHAEMETMRLRAKVIDASEEVAFKPLEDARTSEPCEDAITAKQVIVWDGKKVEATFWDRSKIGGAGKIIHGPAVVTEMDSNTLILPGYYGKIDSMGNILIWPTEKKEHGKIAHTKESAQELIKEQPIIATLIASALGSIRREMDALLLRCAMSPAIREQQDEFNVITNRRGQMLVGQFGSFIQQFLDGWKGTVEEGDVFVTNDVYQTDGAVSHLNDVLVVLPIYYEHNLIGWAANFGHITDMQGKVPGSMSINASTIYEDGLQVPIVKLYTKGVYNETLATVLFRNSRTPDWFQSDLMALVTACRTAATRVTELCGRYSLEVYEAAADYLLEQNKLAISRIINDKISDEVSSFTDFIDDDGQGVGPYAITCSMKKENGKLIFDWDGTSPQSNSSMNFYLSITLFKMFIGYHLLAIYDPYAVSKSCARLSRNVTNPGRW
jgi:5-oxoprolinase (ATP-hydrolysing)